MSEKKYSTADAGPHIERFLNAVCKAGGFKLTYTIAEADNPHPDFENPDLIVKFGGHDVELLLANKAELLLALEQLTMEALGMPSEDHSLLCFDANDYRMLRIEELRLSALTAAEKVRKTRVPFHFSPMNSRERRIIHLALRNETAVRSESVGMGPTRQVVIVPADMKELPPPVLPRRGPGGPPRSGFPRSGPPRGGPSRGGPPRGRRR